jgi:alcohol dehydrogenase (cytochrome c)
VPDAADALTTMADRVRRAPAVSFERIVHADQEPQNWLTYSGNLLGWRHSSLALVTLANVKDLELAWTWQSQSEPLSFVPTPLVVDGVMYTIQVPNDVVALDAATGRVLWTHTYTPAGAALASTRGGRPNRGLAILGHTLFLGTLDAHLRAIDAYSGRLLWSTKVADALDPACIGSPACYVITHAPLVAKDRVIVGVGGGDGSIRGFIAAFDATTGKEMWRFHTIPAAGEPGNDTWSGESWKTGGVGVWNAGSYDADLNLTYWGTGNPAPLFNSAVRLGDNLYSNSVVALDGDTGKLRWHYQFTPNDDRDWDAAQVPVLADLTWQGQARKVLLFANKNGLMYVLDRATGQFLMGKPFVDVNWMSGFDATGRPIRVPAPQASVRPAFLSGATNWYPPSYSLATGLLYVPANGQGFGAIRALEPRTGDQRWEFRLNGATFTSGVLTTASNLLFTGTSGGALVDRYFHALDARTGELLWRTAMTGSVRGSPITYTVGGKQYIAVAAGNMVSAFALRQ